jgi:prepilin-type N-terminal cleavage/methylation domain-containing protein
MDLNLSKKGFTLVELGVVLAIISIMSAVAIPNIISIMADYRLKAAVRDIMSNFQRAKMVAIKRNTLCTISFKVSADGEDYDYIAFIDEDRDYEYDSCEAILISKELSDYKSGVTFDLSKGGGDGLTFKNNGNGCPSISFNSRGLAISPGGASGMGMGSVYLKNNRNTQKCVSVHKTGRIKIY